MSDLLSGFYIINTTKTGFVPPAVVRSKAEMQDIAEQHKNNIWFATYDLVVKDHGVVCQSHYPDGQPIRFYPTSRWILFLYMPPED